jgi:hypothetical protein
MIVSAAIKILTTSANFLFFTLAAVISPTEVDPADTKMYRNQAMSKI